MYKVINLFGFFLSQLLRNYQEASTSGASSSEASCSGTSFSEAAMETIDESPQNQLPETEQKTFCDAAIQCDLGIRWPELQRKPASSVGKGTS